MKTNIQKRVVLFQHCLMFIKNTVLKPTQLYNSSQSNAT